MALCGVCVCGSLDWKNTNEVDESFGCLQFGKWVINLGNGKGDDEEEDAFECIKED